jgi:hypothetical protein
VTLIGNHSNARFRQQSTSGFAEFFPFLVTLVVGYHSKFAIIFAAGRTAASSGSRQEAVRPKENFVASECGVVDHVGQREGIEGIRSRRVDGKAADRAAAAGRAAGDATVLPSPRIAGWENGLCVTPYALSDSSRLARRYRSEEVVDTGEHSIHGVYCVLASSRLRRGSDLTARGAVAGAERK